MEKVAVVILNWNGCEMLRSFLPSVVAHSEADGAVVYVADNGSTDASVQLVRKEFPSVRLIQLEKNWGFADGYNEALKQVAAEYVVLLNSDVEVTAHWLQPLLAYMDTHSEVAACQPKLLSWHDKSAFEYAGAAGGFIDCYGYPFCRGRIMGVVEKDEGQYDTVVPVFWATGAALFIRRKDYWEAGGLEVSMYPPKCSLSRGWCYVEERKSPQDISEFPQQFVDALQEPACRRIRKSDACSLVARPGGSFCLSAERSVGQCLCRLAGTSGVLSASSLVPSVARGERKEGLHIGDTRAYTLQCSDTLLSEGEKTFFRPIKSVFLYAPPLLLFQYRLPWVGCVWIVSGQCVRSL